MALQYSRQSVIDMLRRLDFPGAADEAARALPDPVDIDELEKFAQQHGISRDDLISRSGGSP
jgi:hypothetical protein